MIGKKNKKTLQVGLVLFFGLGLTAAAALFGCRGGSGPKAPPGSLANLMQERGLSEDDVEAALKTYTPSGKHDPYYLFASGGHSGHLIVIGVPSMRILKYIAVFTPEPWQGYGFDDDTKKMLKDSSPRGQTFTWGDVHHPALSETNGNYDGEFVFANDKATGRIAVVNLKDFNTVQIVRSKLLESDHGGAFVTPNTEYVIESGQYPVPLDGAYVSLDEKNYNQLYRGAAVFWKFDRNKGRIIPEESFAIELPPYMQDLADAGKLASDGFAFFNSFNTERAIGGDAEGKPAMESGASQNDMDYLHIVNWRKASQVAADPNKVQHVHNMRVISLNTAVAEGILHLVPEPKSPHGVDVTPDGEALSISGKLDTHVTVYSFAQMRRHMEEKIFAGADPYGVPILPFKETVRGQVEVGLGPLHTQYDDKGNAYTSLFLESKVARWSLSDLQVQDKIPVHYNVGHICVAGGDTVNPDGRYLVSMNKWAIDRFAPVGPLLPQNFQLIDVTGEKMKLLYDMPIGLGEPHYAQMIAATKINPWKAYTPVGMNPITHEPDPQAVKSEREARVERHGNEVDIYLTLIRSHLTPDTIRIKQGDTVRLHLTSLEQTLDATHGFSLGGFNINVSMEPGKCCNVTFQANRAGVFPFYCSEFCSALHLEMMGYLLVEPQK